MGNWQFDLFSYIIGFASPFIVLFFTTGVVVFLMVLGGMRPKKVDDVITGVRLVGNEEAPREG